MAAAKRTRRDGFDGQPDLFSSDRSDYIGLQLSALEWPPADRFPVNHAGGWTRQQVWPDLRASPHPTVVAGFSAIEELIELAVAWSAAGHDGPLRLLIGSEPFTTTRTSFASSRIAFTEEVSGYWLERGVSLRHSAKVLSVIELITEGRIAARVVEGRTRLHAKLYVGVDAATVGSSNFTRAGLIHQIEANVRFERGAAPDDHAALVTIADNLWSVGAVWDDELVALLQSLLRVVSWREAIARATAELLEGEWADRYLTGDLSVGELWPSQKIGIAQALWIAENVGSVLVADATGSGKTRMGAHLLRALHDRMWRTGRVRRGVTAAVTPPPVVDAWRSEAISCGMSMFVISHGLLSRDRADDLPRDEARAVATAQILAVDEAHNFLNLSSKRTQRIYDNFADHVVMFTATPINRDARDLLRLVNLLGADNFADETLAVLDRLERRNAAVSLGDTDRARLRREIQRFTVRRTKQQLNELVERDPSAYTDPTTGHVCRYPTHDTHTYPTGETDADEATARLLRGEAETLLGIGYLGTVLEVPRALRGVVDDRRWLDGRLRSAAGLATHRVLAALRSSRAALVEHLVGTSAARDQFGLPSYKAGQTGDMIAAVGRRRADGPPEIRLDCELPRWLANSDGWDAACDGELAHYRAILDRVHDLSDARERAKADLLANLAGRHARVLAFDHHPATLAVLAGLLDARGTTPIVATGSDNAGRKRVRADLAPDSSQRAVALCSDALNEGINLQGASTIVHLDLPTTLRVVEQRVGRIDRMNSPHRRIETWWPDDGPAFITGANERLIERTEQSAALLGSNIVVPGARTGDAIDLHAHIADLVDPHAEPWDGIQDALDPVRRLVDGAGALIDRPTYDLYRTSRARVLARIAPVDSTDPWAFFSVAGIGHGAPRWLLIEHERPPIIDLDDITDRLRQHLGDDPPNRELDETATVILDQFLATAARHEIELLPRRLRRALTQMATLCNHWADSADSIDAHTGWNALAELASPSMTDQPHPDPHTVAQRWIELIRPALADHRARHRRRRYTIVDHITPHLSNHPLDLAAVQHAMSGLEVSLPLDQRITACILGVPTQPSL